MDDRPVLPALTPMTVDIEAVYQPIVALAGRAVVGYESLIRTATGAPFSTPPELLRAAEAQNVTVAFDWRCRLTALQGALGAGFPDGLALFVNTEPAALETPPPASALPVLADAARLAVTVEITERHLMRDPAALLRAVDHARYAGWRIAIDDVGADSSSLALLPLLRPDVIKLDMALVQGRSTYETAAIVAAVAAESERTGALVLAEGIETEEHASTASGMGATLGQGFLFGRPAPLPSFRDAVSSRSAVVADPAVTVRAPVAVSPYGVIHPLGPPRRADRALVDAMEENLLRSATASGPSTVVLMTTPSETTRAPVLEALLDQLAACTALTTVFVSGPLPEHRRYRAMSIDDREPMALERSTVVVSPLLTAALIALHRGRSADGTELYDYRLVSDRKVVLDAATVLLRRVPAAASSTHFSR